MNTAKLIRRAMTRTLRGNLRNTAAVTLHYVTGRVIGDIDDEATWTGTPVVHADPVKALVHFISPETVVNRGFIELRAGDVIVDFDPKVTFAGMQDLTFGIDGRLYGQKAVSKEATAYYDTIVSGERMFRTVVLTLLGGKPAEIAEGTGLVRWVGDSTVEDLYAYDFATRIFTPSGTQAGRIEIGGADDDWLASVKVNGILALAVSPAGTLLTRSRVAGALAITAAPRAEFIGTGGHYAALTPDGELTALAFIVQPARPSLATDFEFLNGAAWLFSIGPAGVYAPAFSTALP
jgi:hypothetical protein